MRGVIRIHVRSRTATVKSCLRFRFFVVVAVECKPFRLFSIVVGEQQRGGERLLLIDRRLLDVLNWTGEHPGPRKGRRT